MRPSRPPVSPRELFLTSPSVTWLRPVTTPYKLLLSLERRHTKGVNRMTLLAIDGEVIVSILHSLFFITREEYEEGPGEIWDAKG